MIRQQARKCLRGGAIVIVPVAPRHRDLVIRRGCPECNQLTRLRPLADSRPLARSDGEWVDVRESEVTA